MIFVALALAWAVYLIPKAIRHHEELAHTRSVDRFSSAMRVLARREPVSRRDARLVVTPARSGHRLLGPTGSSSGFEAAHDVGASEALTAFRSAARRAARRRRRTLALLLVADVVLVALAYLAVVPWWTVAVPGVLTAGHLALGSVQARRERRQDRRLAQWASRPAAVAAGPTDESSLVDGSPRRAARVSTAYVGPTGSPSLTTPAASAPPASVLPATAPPASAPERVDQPVVAGTPVAAPMPAAETSSLWDPVPMTLPTYITKPRAPRTIRTIDLDQPGAWSSGRSPADSKMVQDSATAAKAARERESAKAPEDGPNGRRAVGT